MKPIEFKETNITFGTDQEDYKPLPALKFKNGKVVTCWRMPFWERVKFLASNKIWLSIQTFNEPLQPVFLSTKQADIYAANQE